MCDEDELDTDNRAILTSSSDSVRSKFLDCVAELVSRSKGWDYVVATALYESVDSIEIGIARNSPFRKKNETMQGCGNLDVDERFLHDLQSYLADSAEESMPTSHPHLPTSEQTIHIPAESISNITLSGTKG